jgi:hypothetical protein
MWVWSQFQRDRPRPCRWVEALRIRDMYMFMCYAEPMKDTRLIALIEAGQMRRLKAAAKREKVSLAEVVRRAISAYLEATK